MQTSDTAKAATALCSERPSNIEQLGSQLDITHTTTPIVSQADNALTPSLTDLASRIRVLKIDQIGDDPALQMRESGLDAGIVAEYAEAMIGGAIFPPVVIFYDGTDYWLADGFHRVGAVKKLGLEIISADVRHGTRREAILYSVGANESHGLRRTAADKRRAIAAMLRDPQWARWSDREIGKRCAVDHKTVAKVRAELTDDLLADRTYITKHGTIATMSTAAIGKRTGEFPTDKPNGSMMGQMLAQVSDDALLAECRRRKLVVCDAH
jgi:hypothetical protein